MFKKKTEQVQIEAKILKEVRKPQKREPSEIIDVVVGRGGRDKMILTQTVLRNLIAQGDIILDSNWKLTVAR